MNIEMLNEAESIYGESITKFADLFAAYLWVCTLESFGQDIEPQPGTPFESLILLRMTDEEIEYFGIKNDAINNARECILCIWDNGYVSAGPSIEV